MRKRNARSRAWPISSSRPERSIVDGAIESRGTAVGDDRLAQRRFADQHVVGRDAAVAAVDAEPGRGVALRIEIDDQHALADRGERRAEIDRRRGLADAALLVGDGEHARRLGRLGALGQTTTWANRSAAGGSAGGRRLGGGFGQRLLGLNLLIGHANHGFLARLRSPRTTTMRLFGLVLLGTSSASMFQYLDALVNSALYILSLGKQTLCTRFQQRMRQLQQLV